MNPERAPVVVLYGAVAPDAPADEQDVLVEVETVTRALESLGYRVEPLALTLDLESARCQLRRLRPRLVFNLVEALAGSGRFIHLAPALLEELGVCFTGAPLEATLLTSNKRVAKRLLVQAAIPTPPWRPVDGNDPAAACPPPWLVKSVWEHASIGLDDTSLVHTVKALEAKLTERHARLGGDWFAETYIEGREFNLALLAGPDGWEVLPPAEIRFQGYAPGKPKIVGYPAKWDSGSFEYGNTPRCFDFPAADRPLLETLRALARRCAALFQVRGYARVDFRVDAGGRPWVLEVNINPCLAPDAGFAAAARQAGLTIEAAVKRIVAAALADAGRA